jgi:hypothetical protein
VEKAEYAFHEAAQWAEGGVGGANKPAPEFANMWTALGLGYIELAKLADN